LPELIAFYEDHAQDRDKFEVLAIHDDAVKSFAELDKKLASIKQRNWQGKDLPFPILLDGNKETHELYGIRSWPSGLLIDPNGKLVGEAHIGELEAKLPRLPAAKIWARHRDMRKNVDWSFDPKEYTVSRFADMMKRWAGCDITVDVDAVKACGLTADGPLPGFVAGSPITLRSLEQLLLAPHGLGFVPSGQELRITTKPRKEEPLSQPQKLRAKELEDRLSRAGIGTEEALQLDAQPLLDALKRIHREFDLSVALDAGAMHAGRLDPQATVRGTIDPNRLRASLLQVITPLGLTVEVRHEVVLITRATGK
jgi:hypothetical protein